MEETKVCIGPCGKEKPATDFYLNATIGQPDRRRSECKSCRRAYAATLYWSDPDASRERSAWSNLYYNYKLTQEDYFRLLAAQGGRCAICETDDPSPHSKFSVDHDHSCCPGVRSCGKCVRRLLCLRCNNNLGWFEKYAAEIKKYLEAFDGYLA